MNKRTRLKSNHLGQTIFFKVRFILDRFFGFCVKKLRFFGFCVKKLRFFGFSVLVFITVCEFSVFSVSIWFSVFAKNSNGFSDLICDAVFGFFN